MSDARTAQIERFLEAVAAFGPALHQPFHEELLPYFEEYAATEGWDGYLAQVAAATSPQAAGYAAFYARNPYANREVMQTRIQECAARGWLILEENGFVATQKAQDFFAGITQVLIDHMARREAGVDVDIPRLTDLLGRLVQAARTVGVITDKPNIEFAHYYETADKTPSLVWVRRHLVTIGAYRDDSHIASWKPLGLPGYVWETFTFVWQGDANTAAGLAEKLAGRGYTEEDYAHALNRLTERGWLAHEDDHFALTEAGRKVREAAEVTTNRNYAAIFRVLTEAELEELVNLLNALTEAVTIREEAQAA